MIKRPFQNRKPVLAVQWNRTTVDYVLAERKDGQVTFTAAGTIERLSEEGLSEERLSEERLSEERPSEERLSEERLSEEGKAVEQASPGELLREELQRRGVRHAELLVALGRGSVDVIPLQLPPAGDDELPAMVANQVIRDAGDIAETGIIDFVSLDTSEGQPRQVFAFAVDRATIEQVIRESSKAGLKPCAVVYRPLASVTLLRRLVPESRRTMVLVTLHEWEADLSIVRNGSLLYTRTARLVESTNLGDIAAQLAVEVRRSLAAASLTADPEEQHLYMFGLLDDGEQLVQDLAEELSLPASLLDPLRGEHREGVPPASIAPLSPLIGMIHEHFDHAHPLDFLHPKQPPPPPNYYRRGAVYAAAVLALVGVGAYYLWDARSQAVAEIAELRDSLDNTTAKLEKVKQKQAVVDAVWRWQTDNVNWLDELYDLTRRFPNGRDAIIRRLTISPGRDGELVIDLYVQVRDPAVITQLGDQLRDSFHDVRSKGVSEQSASTDYPWQFETRITLRKRDVDEYRKSTPDVPPDGNIAATPLVTVEKK